MKKRNHPILFLFNVVLLAFASNDMNAQASFTPAATYFQDFGTSTVAAWTDNSTFPGWYALSWKVASAGTDPFRGTTNITAAAPVNSGGWYVYQCNGGTDMKLGTRPSNNSGGPDSPGMDNRNGITIGVCIQNNLPAISSLSISFDAFQLSLSQEGGNNQLLFFDYLVSGSIPALSAAGYTHVAALDYTAPINSGIAGSNQINGYPCPSGTCQSSTKSACVTVSIPSGSYIMLRWWDPNDGSNDPHLAIDNVSVTAYSDNICSTILPIELLDFSAKAVDNNSVNLDWVTSSEMNNDFFTVERSVNGDPFQPIAYVNGSGTTTQQHFYTAVDHEPGTGVDYYRLRQTDFNGQSSLSSIRAVNFEQDETFSGLFYVDENGFTYDVSSEENFDLLITDLSGRIIYEQKDISPGKNTIGTSEWPHGMYIVRCNNRIKSIVRKIVF